MTPPDTSSTTVAALGQRALSPEADRRAGRGQNGTYCSCKGDECRLSSMLGPMSTDPGPDPGAGPTPAGFDAATDEPRYLFSGRVHPERYGWHLAEAIDGSMSLDGEAMKLRMTISRAQVVIEVRGAYSGEMSFLKNRIQDIGQGIVDSVGFGYVAGLDLELVSCTDPRGHVWLFAPAFDRLRSWPTALTEDEVSNVRELAIASGGVFGVRAALADLRQAVRAPADTPFHCYRAIESIRQELLPEGAEDTGAQRRASWDKLREVSGLAEADLQWIVPEATARRHGELLDVSEADRMRAMDLARRVVLSFARAGAGAPAAESK